MTPTFLGTGWSFPVDVDGGRITEASDDDKVCQAIQLILRTAPGERVMRPDFGCGIHDIVFDTLSEEMLGRVQREVSEALAKWEPRIDVLRVTALQDPENWTRLLVEIDYRVRSTNSRFNLVFPFYVD
ncbi:MAG TPA: GPW/gp25 family protein [Kofleriaceae bacterium]